MHRRYVQFSQIPADGIGDGNQLSVAFTRANHEIVCKNGDSPNVQQKDVLPLLFFQGLYDGMRKF